MKLRQSEAIKVPRPTQPVQAALSGPLCTWPEGQRDWWIADNAWEIISHEKPT
jgi:hypothetical protein